MKLSTKIIFGFILTNILYIGLQGAILFFVRPVDVQAGLMSNYILRGFELASDMLFNVAEERSHMRAFIASPTNDRAIFDIFAAASKAADDDIAQLSQLLSEPEIAYLITPALTESYRKLITLNDDYTKLAMATPERQDTMLNARTRQFTAYETAVKALQEALTLETENFTSDIQAGTTSQSDLLRRMQRLANINGAFDNMNISYISCVRGFIQNDMALFDESLALTGKAVELLKNVIADTRRDAVRVVLDNALKAVEGEFLPAVKALADLLKVDSEVTIQRSALVDSTINEARSVAAAMREITVTFTGQMSAAVSTILVVMAIGAVAALAVSMVLAMFLTRSIVRPINVVIESLTESAQEVESASSQLTSASNTLAEGATENAASLEETSAALEELSSMTKRNADNAMEANSLTGQASEAVTGAQGAMNKVIGAMEEISRSGNEIGKIIKTIDEIAFQTNLLALNAAVEAARAGEAGAGFAVVADEVRNLAIRSADAAKNTADLIAATISNINSGSEMVNTTAELFQTVEGSTAKVSELVSEVAEASKEQNQGISQISTAMGEMDKVTQSNAASAEEAASAASQLSLQAGNLLTVVNEMNALAHGADAAHRQISGSGGRRPAAHAEPAVLPKGDTVSTARAANKVLPMNSDNFEF